MRVLLGVRRSHWSVGLLGMAAGFCLAILMLKGEDLPELFARKITVTTYLQNAYGLKDGSTVEVQGVRVGSVASVTLVDDARRTLAPVRVVMRIERRKALGLKKDCVAGVTTKGQLGDAQVEITNNTATGESLRDGDEVRTLEHRIE